MKYSGSRYTWTNKQIKELRICFKIDRVLANESWLEIFNDAEVVFMKEGMFDYTPTLIQCNPIVFSGRKIFTYFRMWKEHTNFEMMVRRIWEVEIRGTKMYQLATRLKLLKKECKELNRV